MAASYKIYWIFLIIGVCMFFMIKNCCRHQQPVTP